MTAGEMRVVAEGVCIVKHKSTENPTTAVQG
jgi:hypothetical protein